MDLWQNPENADSVTFDDKDCQAHSTAYYCQPVKTEPVTAAPTSAPPAAATDSPYVYQSMGNEHCNNYADYKRWCQEGNSECLTWAGNQGYDAAGTSEALCKAKCDTFSDCAAMAFQAGDHCITYHGGCDVSTDGINWGFAYSKREEAPEEEAACNLDDLEVGMAIVMAKGDEEDLDHAVPEGTEGVIACFTGQGRPGICYSNWTDGHGNFDSCSASFPQQTASCTGNNMWFSRVAYLECAGANGHVDVCDPATERGDCSNDDTYIESFGTWDECKDACSEQVVLQSVEQVCCHYRPSGGGCYYSTKDNLRVAPTDFPYNSDAVADWMSSYCRASEVVAAEGEEVEAEASSGPCDETVERGDCNSGDSFIAQFTEHDGDADAGWAACKEACSGEVAGSGQDQVCCHYRPENQACYWKADGLRTAPTDWPYNSPWVSDWKGTNCRAA